MSEPARQEIHRVGGEVERLGRRAVHAYDLADGGGAWTPNTVLAASRALGEGARVAGVRRAYPRLAASLKRIGGQWLARTMKVGEDLT